MRPTQPAAKPLGPTKSLSSPHPPQKSTKPPSTLAINLSQNWHNQPSPLAKIEAGERISRAPMPPASHLVVFKSHRMNTLPITPFDGIPCAIQDINQFPLNTLRNPRGGTPPASQPDHQKKSASSTSNLPPANEALSVSCFLFPISCFLFPISYFLFPIS